MDGRRKGSDEKTKGSNGEYFKPNLMESTMEVQYKVGVFYFGNG